MRSAWRPSLPPCDLEKTKNSFFRGQKTKDKRDEGEGECARVRGTRDNVGTWEQQPGSVELALAEGVAFQSNILFTP
eukprot:scaffold9772_cov128-Isochrysis_galbana.AAC.7